MRTAVPVTWILASWRRGRSHGFAKLEGIQLFFNVRKYKEHGRKDKTCPLSDNVVVCSIKNSRGRSVVFCKHFLLKNERDLARRVIKEGLVSWRPQKRRGALLKRQSDPGG